MDKKFSDDLTNIEMQKEKQQILAVHISIVGCAFLFLISLVVGIISDSVALLLDASTGLVTLAVAFLVRFSIKKINKPPDDLYNFGYGKYEPLTVTLQGALIIITCLVCMKFAIQDIIHAEDITRYDIPTITAFISGLLGIIIALYLKRTALRTHSSILKISSLHWYIDSGLSFGMSAGFFFGLVLRNLGYTHITPYVDPVMAVILALFFITTPVKTVTYGMLELLDVVPAKDMREMIRNAVREYKPQPFSIHRLRFRKAGRKIFIDVCFVANENLTVAQVHELANRFEKDLAARIQHCDVLVYFKPAKGESS